MDAMVLAAGLGLRMRPLTLAKPKPLIEVGGRSMLDRCFDRLREADVSRAVVNVHYLPDQIVDWARKQPTPEIMISDERALLLETGGGVANALPLLRSAPFIVLNSDSFWVDGKEPALKRLVNAWRDADMDCLLLLTPLPQTVGFDGKGDFQMTSDGRLTRFASGEPLAYSGTYLAHPRIFKDAPPGKFSMNLLWDRAIAEGRLFGLRHNGLWLHVGTPAAIAPAEAALKQRNSPA
jgi:N-acetyl-alpha-D-muramate 1-phosphate uridylyltransferase